MAEADELITWLGFKFKPDAKKNIEQAKKSIDMIKNGVQKIGAFFLGASGAIGYFTNNVMGSAQEMSDLSKKMGVSTDALQQWKYVAEASGQSFEGLIGDLEQFRKVGIDAVSLSGKLAGMNSKIALQYKDRLGLSDDMFNILRKGPAEIKKLMSEAYVIPKESIEQTATFNKQLSATKNTLRAMKDEIFMAVSPILVDVLNSFKEWLKENKEWISLNLGNIIEGVALGFKKFVAIGKTVFDVLKGILERFGLISDEGINVEKVANVITGILLTWSGGKILGGLGSLFTVFKGIFGLFGAITSMSLGATFQTWGLKLLKFKETIGGVYNGLLKFATMDITKGFHSLWSILLKIKAINFGAVLSSWGMGFKNLLTGGGKIMLVVAALKAIWNSLMALKDFWTKGVSATLSEWKERARNGEDLNFVQKMGIGFGELGESAGDWISDKFRSGAYDTNNPFKNVKIPAGYGNTGPTTNNTNSGNTINIQMPYEQAVSFVRDTTGGEAMMTMSPGAFGGNFQ